MAVGNSTIGSLKVNLGLDSAQFETGLRAANTNLAGFGKAAGGAASSSKALAQAGLGLSRQFADVGVSLAGGINPMTVLIQQGPQIADVFASAKQQGLGFGGMMKGLAGSINPVTLGIAAVGAAAVAGFGLFSREIDKSTKHATSWGDTFKATVKVIGDIIMDGPIGDGLKWLGAALGKTLDAVLDGVMFFAGKVVGHFGAAFQLITNHWNRLPEVFAVLLQGAANVVISAVQGIVNTVLKGVNHVLKAANLSQIGEVNLPKIKVVNTKIAKEYDTLASDIEKSFHKGAGSIGDRIAAQADKEYLARQKQKKGSKERADALSDEEKAARKAAEGVAEYIAKLEQEVAQIGLNEIALRRLEAARQIEAALALGDVDSAARIKNLVLEREAMIELAAVVAGTKDAHAELKKSAGEALTTITANVPSAVGQFDQFGAQVERLEGTFYSVTDAVDGVFAAIKNNDWVGALSGIISSVKLLQKAFESTGTTMDKFAAIAGIASSIGGAIGGKAGGALSGAASGALAGAQLGSIIPGIGTLVGGAIGGVLGGLGGLLGAGKEKKRRKAEEAARKAQEEANRLAAIANQRRELEIALLEAQGKSTEALAERRKDELAAMDETNRSLAKQLYDLADAAEAAAKAEEEAAKAADFAARRRELEIALMDAQGDSIGALTARRQLELDALEDSLDPLAQAIFAAQDLAAAQEAAAEAAEVAADAARVAAEKALTQREFEIRIMEALGDSAGALAARRAMELDALDDTFDGMQQIIWAAEDFAEASKAAQDAANEVKEDAAGRVADARNALSEAYEREADALRSTISRFREFSENLKAFRESLSGAGSGAAISAEFKRVANLARLGNEQALGELPGAGQRFLESEKSTARTLTDYLRSVGVVRAAVQEAENTANRTLSIAERDLAANEAAALAARGTEVNTLLISDGIVALNNALAAQAALQTASIQQMAAFTEANRAPDPTAAILALAHEMGLTRAASETTASVLQRVTLGGDGMVIAA